MWIPLQGWNGWSSASDAYIPTDEYESTIVIDEIYYGIGYVKGRVFKDVVRFTQFGFPLRISMLGVTIADDLAGMPSDGLMGLSPRQYGNNELLTDKLFATRTIDINAFGVSYLNAGENSKIIFGGWDKTIVPHLDNFTWFDLVGTYYWSVNVTGVSYGDINLSTVQQIGVLDTGTSFVYFPNSTFRAIWDDMQSKHTGWEIYETGWKKCNCDSPSSFSDITIQIDGINTVFTYHSYIGFWFNQETQQGEWFLFISESNIRFFEDGILLGDAYLRSYYMYHDIGGAKVGFFSRDNPINATAGRQNLELERLHKMFEIDESLAVNKALISYLVIFALLIISMF